jgi:hypothetical protein
LTPGRRSRAGSDRAGCRTRNRKSGLEVVVARNGLLEEDLDAAALPGQQVLGALEVAGLVADALLSGQVVRVFVARLDRAGGRAGGRNGDRVGLVVVILDDVEPAHVVAVVKVFFSSTKIITSRVVLV